MYLCLGIIHAEKAEIILPIIQQESWAIGYFRLSIKKRFFTQLENWNRTQVITMWVQPATNGKMFNNVSAPGHCLQGFLFRAVALSAPVEVFA